MKSSKKIMVLQLVELFVIVFAWTIQGSTGSVLQASPALSPLTSAAVPPMMRGSIPSLPLHSPTVSPPLTSAEVSPTIKGSAPPNKPPVPVALAPAQGGPPTSRYPENSPAISPVVSGKSEPSIPVQGAPPPNQFSDSSPAISPIVPGESPPITPVYVVPPATGLPQNSPAISPVVPGKTPPAIPDGDVSPVSTPPTGTKWKRKRIPDAPPPNETPEPIPPVNRSPTQGSVSAAPPPMHNPRHITVAPSPSDSFPKSSPIHGYRSPTSSPSTSIHNDQHPRDKVTSPAHASYLVSPPSKQQDRIVPPAVSQIGRPPHHAPPPFLPPVLPKRRSRLYTPPPFPPSIPPTGRSANYAPPPFLRAVPHRGRPRQYALPPSNSGTPDTRSQFPMSPSMSQVSPAPSPVIKTVSGSTTMSFNPHHPRLSPSGSLSKRPGMSPPPPILGLPPPPPNEDCSGTICTEPLTNTPPGSLCACVWPMQVGLILSVDLYTFFPLVSELATEIASGVFMKQSQVRIMGANAASQQPEKTIVLVDLVPLGEKFDNTTAFLTFQRFWLKKVDIKEPYFGDYEVLYVRYQGLPPSPPLPPSSIGMIDDGPYSGNDNNGQTIKPLGVDVRMKKHKNGLSGSIIAIIVLSAFVVLVLCSAAAWVLLLKHRSHASQQPPTPQASLPSLAKQSGTAGSMIGSMPSSASLSFGSGIATYMGSAKTYSIADIERATNNFEESRVLGEGGFGRVYRAILDDGIEAAVKVLKRVDQQGGREFLAEVEMLSRLHHRNLVKLIGICTEEQARCLVYELIPNGSVESHLHGIDKETAPLDWVARMKIALGAARGLAYLHEDSSPRVIHRDFKSSNILLENDFTPKVSDFGLARTALDEESRHISTRVMGTFGYVAPEYAMTGHLLVKSDVYSYGVVLLELLTGRKPVDMSQPPGQENLVAWARPLLASKEGMEVLIDSSLGSTIPLDSVAKVAAIASMCVQPEVSHRPFMGEVVQALKLVCNECDTDEAKEIGSRTSSQEDLSIDMEGKVGSGSELSSHPLSSYQYSTPTYDFNTPVGFGGQASGSFRRNSSSGPLRMGRGWQRTKGMSGGSVSEHGAMFRLHPGSY